MQDDEFRIQVAFLSGGEEILTVKDSDLIRDLKTRVRESRKLAEGVKLIHRGCALPDNRTLKSVGVGPIAAGCPVLIYAIQAAREDRFDQEQSRSPGLRIVNLTGGRLTVPAQDSDRVLTLKLTLQPKVQLLPSRMRLLHCGVELRDEETLEFYGVASTSTIYLLARPAGIAAGQGTAKGSPEQKLDQEDSGIAGIFRGMLIERRIDSFWFPAKVLKVVQEDMLKVDMQYLDDGNVELGVDWLECRHTPG